MCRVKGVQGFEILGVKGMQGLAGKHIIIIHDTNNTTEIGTFVINNNNICTVVLVPLWSGTESVLWNQYHSIVVLSLYSVICTTMEWY